LTRKFPFEEAFISPNDNANGMMIGRIIDRTKTTLYVINEIPTATIAQLAELTGKSQRTIWCSYSVSVAASQLL